MNMLKRTLFCALLLSCSSAAGSLAAASDQFLDACLRIAESRDKQLAVAAEQIKLARIRTTRSARSFLPFLSAERKYARGKVDLDASADGYTPDEYQSEELGLRASQIIFEGGKTRATYLYDSLMAEMAQYNYTKNREELFLKIKAAYYEMLSSNMEYTVLYKAFEEINRLGQKVRNEYKAKAISELDMIEAENFRDKVENLLKSAEASVVLANKKLAYLTNVASLEEIPVMVPDGLADDVPEISFTLPDLLGYLAANNLDLKIAQLQIKMAEQRIAITRSKVIPKFYLDGFYGQSGEAFVKDPLELTTVWSLMARMSWGLWGNSLEINQTTDHTVPTNIVEVSQRTDSSSLDVKLNLFDDLNHFVDAKESGVNREQTFADYNTTRSQSLLTIEKAFNEYDNSLRNARTLKNEITLRQRKLTLMRKQNDLYEVPTVQVMEQSWRYAETVSSYSKAINANYAAVAEMEKMTMIPLR
jgi:outer membrane protein TolC